MKKNSATNGIRICIKRIKICYKPCMDLHLMKKNRMIRYNHSVNLHEKVNNSATNRPRICFATNLLRICIARRKFALEEVCYKRSVDLHRKEKKSATKLPKISNSQRKITSMKKKFATILIRICSS